jgi:serine/threonine protein kinase
MKIKIKNKETLEELSAMGAGAVSGHVDDREDLEEMYSTSGAMMGAGSGQIPKERNPEAHERYVRMRHQKQGLKNFKPNRYFAENDQKKPKIKIKIIKKIKKQQIKEDIAKAMGQINVEVGKELGRGQFGQVFAGISDDFGPVAIKKVPVGSNGQKEVDNYKKINDARSKSSYIAKHFPEVYDIDIKTDPQNYYIVMEILGVEQGYQQELINTLFGGLNTALKPYEDEKEVSGKFRDRSNRMYVLFKDKKSQESIIQSVYNDFGPDLDFLLPVIKMFLSNIDGYVSNVKSTSKAEEDISFMMLSGKAEEYLYNFANGEFKEEFKTAPWLLTFITEQLVALQKEDSSGSLFARHHQGLILYWLEYIRKSSIIGLRDAEFGTRSLDDSGVEKDQWSAFKEAASIKKAIKDLRDIAGLDPRDMHDQNVMIRPQTGDIVIVDVGLFRKI